MPPFRTLEDNPTLITIHGAWHGPESMANLSHYYNDKFRAVVNLQLPGHGEEEHDPWLTIGDYVKFVRKEIQKITGPKVAIGHSMGGLVLEKCLQTEDCSCDAAIFLAPVPTCGALPLTFKNLLTPQFAAGGWKSLLTSNLRHMVDTPEKVKRLFFSEDTDQSVIKECHQALGSESFLAYLGMLPPRLNIGDLNADKKLLIAAQNDALFSVWQQRITAWQYGAVFDVVPTAHDAMLDTNWPVVTSIIDGWLGIEKQAGNGMRKLHKLAS